MAYDSLRGRFLMFGGDSSLNDTWAYDPSANRWTSLNAVGPPPTGYMGTPAMAYDARADRFILFGVGWPNPNQTWAYDPVANVWSDLRPVNSPIPRHDAGIVYDSASDQILLFGGGVIAPQHTATAFNDTWAYDFATNTWTQLRPAASPDRRFGASMTYDSVADRVILFGGCANGLDLWCTLVNDTWTYAHGSNTWTTANPGVSPSPRYLAPAAYDSRDEATILFGGADDTGVLNDTWTYDFPSNRWTNENPLASPPGRHHGAMAYDPLRNQAFLFGGSLSADWTPAGDTWAYNLGPAVSPAAQTSNPLLLGLTLILVAPAGAIVLWLLLRRGSKRKGS